MSTIPTFADDRDPGAARLLDEQTCRAFGMVAYAVRDRTLYVAASDLEDTLAAGLARGTSGYDVVMTPADAGAVTAALDEAFGHAGAAEDAPGPDPDRPPGPRVGERLLDLGVLTHAQLDGALDEQRRSGGRLGEILVHSGVISEQALLAVLSEHFDVQRVDLSGFEGDPAVAAHVPEPFARRHRVAPVAMDDHGLYVAVAERLDRRTLTELRGLAGCEVRELLATRSSIDELLRRIYDVAYVRDARLGLLESSPRDSAHRVLSGGQKVALGLAVPVVLALLVIWPLETLIGLVAACSLFYLVVSLYRFRLVYLALGHRFEIEVTDEELAALDERDLPTYTILLPLYREANVVTRLIGDIEALDYPRTKLDVRLLCEADDEGTIAAIRSLRLPPHFTLVVVPDSQPKTKPKACNYGLLQATGEYVVIYDGEDRPDPDQLKKAVVAFGKCGSEVSCIQAKLNFYNREQNLLTRWFATEYAMHFDLLLPGLDADAVPIPLGGTSNHFITSRLRQVGAWDPFNVTEDADLGIRLHKAGFRTAVMDSTTLEEANSELRNWIRQRSRWCKGYFQTWLVHMRHPVALLRALGLKGFLSFNLVVGGSLIFLINPVFWALTTAYLLTQASGIQDLFPGFVFYAAAAMLFVGNFSFLYMHLAGAVQRGYFELTKYALLTPVYWGLMSWAAWKGALQLVRNPFYWEKTDHGLDLPGAR